MSTRTLKGAISPPPSHFNWPVITKTPSHFSHAYAYTYLGFVLLEVFVDEEEGGKKMPVFINLNMHNC